MVSVSSLALDVCVGVCVVKLMLITPHKSPHKFTTNFHIDITHLDLTIASICSISDQLI